MTDIAPEMEKAPEQGRKMAHASANFFTYAAWGVVGVLAGWGVSYLDFWTRKPFTWALVAIVIVSAVPAVIGLLVKLLSEKQMPWYRMQAIIAGLIVGGFWGYF